MLSVTMTQFIFLFLSRASSKNSPKWTGRLKLSILIDNDYSLFKITEMFGTSGFYKDCYDL